METPCYKIALIGSAGVGKSTFIKKHQSRSFDPTYIATLGVDVHRLCFNTNYGTIIFEVWDCAGKEKFGGIKEGYWIGSKGCIAMFDVSSNISYKQMERWIMDFRRVEQDVPLIVCGNKVDLKDRVVSQQAITKNSNYFDISAKSNYNYEKPFLFLARALTCKEDLVFV